MRRRKPAKDTRTLKTFRAAPGRMFAFLDGLQTSPEIREMLEEHGLTAAEQDVAWAMLRIPRERLRRVVPLKTPMAAVFQECERFIALGMVIARGKLGLRLPEQAEIMFANFRGDEKGNAAVIVVDVFLERHGDLVRAGGDVEREAVAVLAEAGVNDAKLAELQALVDKSKSWERPAAPAAPPPPDGEEPDLERLRKIYEWMTVWSGIARLVISRKDHLIRLGLASRQPRKRGRVQQEGGVPG